MRTGPVFCLLLQVSSDYAQPITGQVIEVTCPVIGQAQPELTPSKRQKTGPVQSPCPALRGWAWGCPMGKFFYSEVYMCHTAFGSSLTLWCWNKMAAILQMTIFNLIIDNLNKRLKVVIQISLSLFLRVRLTISLHWLGKWAMTNYPAQWHIYASPELNELKYMYKQVHQSAECWVITGFGYG